MPDEDNLITRITRSVPSLTGTKGKLVGVELGIGDDALVLRPGSAKQWVVTTDAFIEDVHFWAHRHPADSVGYKGLARATSDLAAMGATPQFFLLTLALPKARTGLWLDKLLAGMGRAARELGLKLSGGDTTQAAAVSMSFTVIGEIAPGKAVARSGARPGDILYVSGALGRAQLGLELMRRGLDKDRRFRRLLRAHLYPKVQIKLGAWLAGQGVASAMMDLSDGLSADLGRLCAASQVGARLWAAQIPCARLPGKVSPQLRGKSTQPLMMALHGGDDYELLFTVPRRMVGKLNAAPGFSDLHAIGQIQRGKTVSLVGKDGTEHALPALGWDSFREK